MKLEYLYILFSTVLFSSMEITLKTVSGVFNPIQLTFLRFFVGAALLLPLAFRSLRKRKVSITMKDCRYFALTGLICVVISMVFYQLAISVSQASLVAVLFCCNPVFITLFAALFLKEKITKAHVLGMAVSVVGMFIIANPFQKGGNLLGVLFSVIAAVTFALYSVMGKKDSMRFGGIVTTAMSFIIGSIELLLFILISKIPLVADFFHSIHLSDFAAIPILQGITLSRIPVLLYISLGVTGLGYAFYFMAMERTTASTVSLVFFIKPALATLLAYLFLHEPIHFNMVAGILFILLGSGIFLFQNRRIEKIKKELKYEEIP